MWYARATTTVVVSYPWLRAPRLQMIVGRTTCMRRAPKSAVEPTEARAGRTDSYRAAARLSSSAGAGHTLSARANSSDSGTGRTGTSMRSIRDSGSVAKCSVSETQDS